MTSTRHRLQVTVAVLAAAVLVAGLVAWRVLDGGASRLVLTATSGCTYDESDRTLSQTLVLRGQLRGSTLERLRMVVHYREDVGPDRAGATVAEETTWVRVTGDGRVRREVPMSVRLPRGVDRAEVQCGFGYA